MSASTNTTLEADQMKYDALTKIADTQAEYGAIDSGLSGAWPYVIGAILVIGIGFCLWHFLISKSPSGKDCVKSSNAGADSASSSGTYANSFGNSGKSF